MVHINNMRAGMSSANYANKLIYVLARLIETLGNIILGL